jgi:hypothetical protein
MEFNDTNIPLGLAMALAQDPDSMKAFSALTTEQQDSILTSARTAKSRTEIQSLISKITPGARRMDAGNGRGIF